MLIAYYRVSTDRQGRSGLGLEAQQNTVRAYAGQQKADVIAEYTEVESGRRCDRVQLAKAIDHARAARGMLVVAKLDRLARNAKFLLGLVESGVPIVFGDIPSLAAGDPIVGKLTLTVLAAIAEFEAGRMGQRAREAAAVRKSRGLKSGWQATKSGRNPLTGEHQLAGSRAARPINLAAAAAYRRGMLPIVREVQASRTLAQAAEEMNRLGYKTRRGRAWTVSGLNAFLNGRNWRFTTPPDV